MQIILKQYIYVCRKYAEHALRTKLEPTFENSFMVTIEEEFLTT